MVGITPRADLQPAAYPAQVLVIGITRVGPVNGVHDAPQTAHGLAGIGLSASIDFFANSKICGEIIGSLIGFFFIAVFTIAHC